MKGRRHAPCSSWPSPALFGGLSGPSLPARAAADDPDEPDHDENKARSVSTCLRLAVVRRVIRPVLQIVQAAVAEIQAYPATESFWVCRAPGWRAAPLRTKTIPGFRRKTDIVAALPYVTGRQHLGFAGRRRVRPDGVLVTFSLPCGASEDQPERTADAHALKASLNVCKPPRSCLIWASAWSRCSW